jgi:hypothetical protein
MPEPTSRDSRITGAAMWASALVMMAGAPGAAEAQTANASATGTQSAAACADLPRPAPMVAAAPEAGSSDLAPRDAGMPCVATFADEPLPDLDAAALRLYESEAQVFEATLTANLLQSVGDATRLAGDGRLAGAKPPVDPFRAQPPAGSVPAGGLAVIANPSFGSRDGVAVSITPRLVSSTELHTDIRVRHSGDLVDAGFDLAASQSLVLPDPARVRYDSHALLSLAPAMQLGLAARGSLGTVAAPMLGRDDIAGPLLRLNLTDSNLSLGSDLGYDFDLNPANAATRNQMHFKLNLKLKL